MIWRTSQVRPSAPGGAGSIMSSSGARAAGPEPIVSCSSQYAPSRSSHTAAVIAGLAGGSASAAAAASTSPSWSKRSLGELHLLEHRVAHHDAERPRVGGD